MTRAKAPRATRRHAFEQRPVTWVAIVSPALSLAAILVLATLLVCVR